MQDKFKTFQLFALIFCILSLAGCGYQIRYALNQRDVVLSEKAIPLNVTVAQFSDTRDFLERNKDARKDNGDSDLADYTFDKEFRGEVAVEITKMLARHLNFSGAFDPEAQLASFSYDDLSDSILDSLQSTGVDAVFTGEISHFYGYYDRNIGRQFLYAVPLGVLSGMLLNLTTTSGNYQVTYYWYGPGLMLGYYLESLHKRQIDQRAEIHARLISTSSHQVLWQQNFDAFVSGKRNMPGVNTEQRKYQIAVFSLRDAVNELVTSLANNADLILQSKDQATVYYQREQTQPIEEEAVIQQTDETSQIDLSKPLPSEQAGRTNIGIIGGLNLANFSGDDAEDATSRSGIAAGGFVTFHLSDKFAVRPEILYSTKGAKYESTELYYKIKATTTLNYLDIPILGVFKPTNNLQLLAGPSINVFLNGKTEAKGYSEFMGTSFSQTFSEDIESKDVKSPELGLIVGASYYLQPLNFSARYSMGLTNQPKSDEVDLKNRVIQFMADFSF